MKSFYLISDDKIDEAAVLADESDKSLAREIARHKGYHELIYTRASELFKPVTQSTSNKIKQETDEQIRREIQADPNLSNTDKLQLLSKIDKIKLEKHTDPDNRVVPQNNREQELIDAFSLQNDYIFGLVPLDKTATEYVFGFLELYKSLIHSHLDALNHHRIKFDLVTGKVWVAANLSLDPVELNFPYSKDLLILLTQNTVQASITARQNYFAIIDACLKRELSNLGIFVSRNNYDQLLQQLQNNEKFNNWFSAKYKIPIRVQPKRSETSGHTKYTNTSIYKEVEDSETEDNEGSGLIVLSPNSNERIKRALVLLGNKQSAKTVIPDALTEFTAILDSLLNEKLITVDKYKVLLKKFSA